MLSLKTATKPVMSPDANMFLQHVRAQPEARTSA